MKFILYEPRYFSSIYKWHTDDEISVKIGFENKPTKEETKALIDSFVNDKNRVFFLVEHFDKVVGYVTLSEINKQYEIATLHILIGEKEFLMNKSHLWVMNSILKHAFTDLGLHRVTTYIISNNLKLIETAKKYGWIQEGIMKEIIKLRGQRLNYHIFRILKTEFKRGEICQ